MLNLLLIVKAIKRSHSVLERELEDEKFFVGRGSDDYGAQEFFNMERGGGTKLRQSKHKMEVGCMHGRLDSSSFRGPEPVFDGLQCRELEDRCCDHNMENSCSGVHHSQKIGRRQVSGCVQSSYAQFGGEQLGGAEFGGAHFGGALCGGAHFGGARFEGPYSESARIENLHNAGGSFSGQLAGGGSLYGRGQQRGGGALVTGISNSAGF